MVEVKRERAWSKLAQANSPVGIADPDSDTGQLLGIGPCKDKTVVTSGTYERYFEIDGELYHHVLYSRWISV